ncbi:hypothetical protein RyT2_09480 [Pseudolactococcus yaeyamensis]
MDSINILSMTFSQPMAKRKPLSIVLTVNYEDENGNIWSEDEGSAHGGSKWKKYKNKRDFENDKREGTYDENRKRLRD